jgi:hypothetical protein
MNISGKYLKVWKVEPQAKFVKLDLGDSKKNKDGGYDNWTWFGCIAVGDAKEAAEQLSSGDVIEVVSGQISQNKGKDGKYYNNIVIFDLNVMSSQNDDVIDLD